MLFRCSSPQLFSQGIAILTLRPDGVSLEASILKHPLDKFVQKMQIIEAQIRRQLHTVLRDMASDIAMAFR